MNTHSLINYGNGLMQTRQRKSRPRVGEPVYQEEENRTFPSERPYGKILFVDHEGRQITVKYEDSRLEDYDFDDLQWTDKFGGLWIT